MAVSFKYWDDSATPEDIQSMWIDADVRKEWIDAGERMGQKVHLSRDPDGQPYLTQIEMRAVTDVVVHRHFESQVNPDMICSIAEILSGRQLLAENYDKKAKESKIGIMQMTPSTAQWLVREIGYRYYDIDGDWTLLCRPFVNIYFGAAYIMWLSNYNGIERSEEFIVRAYKGGIMKATHKSTLEFFQKYLTIKESLPPRRVHYMNYPSSEFDASVPANTGQPWIYWDSRTSPDDMDELWNKPDVLKEWTKSGERRGRVRFSHDAEKRPYLSRTEIKAVAEIIVARHFISKRVKASALAALADECSMRFVNGVRSRTGLTGIDYPTAVWLYKDLGYRAYNVDSVDDLCKPFVSMYFGAAYMAWLSEYEGREQSYEFIVQAYLGGGPDKVNVQETGPLWKKFQETLCFYEEERKDQGSGCSIL